MSDDFIEIEISSTTKQVLEWLKWFSKKAFWFLVHSFSAIVGLSLILGGVVLIMAVTPSRPTSVTLVYIAVLGPLYWYTLRWIGWELLKTISD